MEGKKDPEIRKTTQEEVSQEKVNEDIKEKKDYLIIGKILKPFGIYGEIKVLPITDDIRRFENLPFLFIKRYGKFVKLEIEKSRIADRNVLIKLKGKKDRNSVENLRGLCIYIDRDNAIKIDGDSYYYYDIWKCRVKTSQGEEIGVVEDIHNTGSCDVYSVRLKDTGKQVYIPAISDVVKKIDIKSKEIEIEIIEGLF